MDNATNYLSDDEERLLLQIAREGLEHFVRTGEQRTLEAYPLTQNLEDKHGAFVTLRSDGALRGCIGYTRSTASLAEAVRDNAINAASRDPRFPAVTEDELSGIEIEISALCPGEEPGTPFIRVHSIDEIVVGRDGLYLECGGRQRGGLLLPQVPGEQGWGRDAFLEGICRKAGVRSGAWRDPDSQLYRFSAQVFHESTRDGD